MKKTLLSALLSLIIAAGLCLPTTASVSGPAVGETPENAVATDGTTGETPVAGAQIEVSPSGADKAGSEKSGEEALPEIENFRLNIVEDEKPDEFDVLFDGLENDIPDIYAGVYYEKADGVYYLLATDENAMKQHIESEDTLSDAYGAIEKYIAFKAAKYSHNDLVTAVDSLSRSRSNLGHATAINYEANGIKIYTENVDSATESVDSMKRNRSISVENIQIVEQEDAIQNSAYTVLGEQIEKDDGLLYSYGVGATWTYNGNRYYGHLTAGHNVDQGDTFYYDGDELGTVSSRVSDEGDIDAALLYESGIQLLGNRTIDGIKVSTSGAAREGEDVVKYGYAGGVTFGTVIDASVNFTTATGEYRTDFIVHDAYTANGDSGGPVTCVRADGREAFVGINSARTSSYGYASKYVNIRDGWNMAKYSDQA